ncbi:hypothetical protein [Melghirimyces algeriensis]|nr:hypothetical protein [Melghirimyces algeriensis]
MERDTAELSEISMRIKEQAPQGCIEKNLLIQLNQKLGTIEANYGHIAAIAVTLAAILSGLKDCIELIQSIGK